eukprot:TRINITY_DN69936_c0_g1_i1.p1 TRINITY_DN69936_c0_g1~~TRINITY_DN69936_c0_g1_i1.p1  ORF type:complete len:327 (-),score=20.39 TRINITY_DN69936_c0_g1_i1:62-1042(-)
MFIVSDPHFGANQAEVMEGFVSAVNHLSPSERLVVIAGDITQDSKPSEFELATQWIQKLLDIGTQIVVTQGNHDFGGWVAEKANRFKVPGLKSKYTAAVRMINQLMKPVLQQSFILAVSDDGLDTISLTGQHLFVSLHSQHRRSVRIQSKQISWATRWLLAIGFTPDTTSLIQKESAKNSSSDEDNEPTETSPVVAPKINLDNVQGVVQHKLGETGSTLATLKLHLVCHHSLWSDSDDKHAGMGSRQRLEKSLLVPFQFYSVIHGHNHRFTYQNTTTPKEHYRIRRVGAPSISERNASWEKGYVHWVDDCEPALCFVEQEVATVKT